MHNPSSALAVMQLSLLVDFQLVIWLWTIVAAGKGKLSPFIEPLHTTILNAGDSQIKNKPIGGVGSAITISLWSHCTISALKWCFLPATITFSV